MFVEEQDFKVLLNKQLDDFKQKQALSLNDLQDKHRSECAAYMGDKLRERLSYSRHLRISGSRDVSLNGYWTLREAGRRKTLRQTPSYRKVGNGDLTLFLTSDES